MNLACDHYWLVRRGGHCPHCRRDFLPNFQSVVFPSEIELRKQQLEGDQQVQEERVLPR